MNLHDFQWLTFDCYGTLIDWETGIVAALRPWLDAEGVAIDDEGLLSLFARHETDRQQEAPAALYPDVLAAVHRSIAADLGLAPDAKAEAHFAGSVKDWPAFEDTPAALAYLKQHYRLGILSNVDRNSFAASNARLGATFDAICTAEEIGSYKPAASNFTFMLARLEELGAAPGDILHTAESLYHDHIPAKAAGLATCWIHRRHAKSGHGATRTPSKDVSPDFRFESLSDMVAAHRSEIARVRDRQDRLS